MDEIATIKANPDEYPMLNQVMDTADHIEQNAFELPPEDPDHPGTLQGMVVTNDDVLKPAILNSHNINDGTTYEAGIAYIAMPYYYIFRGTTMTVEYSQGLPGIYLDPTDHYVWIPVTPNNEDDQWKVADKFATVDEQKIIHMLIAANDINLNIPDSGRVFRPEELAEDDMLKRIIKRALKAKKVDIDAYRTRFSDKNALFNFKQVVKNPNSRLSMLLFERGCSALNLKYTITIEEVDPESPIGVKLDRPIVICSEDTFQV